MLTAAKEPSPLVGPHSYLSQRKDQYQLEPLLLSAIISGDLLGSISSDPHPAYKHAIFHACVVVQKLFEGKY